MHPWLHYDKAMLQSLLNMKLRDFYSSLEALCDDMEIGLHELHQVLESYGLVYVKELNQLREKDIVI